MKRQRIEQRAIHHRKDFRIGADAERQGKDCDQRKAW